MVGGPSAGCGISFSHSLFGSEALVVSRQTVGPLTG